MRFVTVKSNPSYIGLTDGARILNLNAAAAREGLTGLPATLEDYIRHADDFTAKVADIDRKFRAGAYEEYTIGYEDAGLVAPISRPASCRDGYAFRQHVATARRNRNAPMIPEFDQYPVFYFTNHHAILGPGDVPCMKDHFQKLDFELEAAIVVGRRGRNIRAKDADRYIFGYTIMNDLSARVLQMEEMLLNLGPAKGKDFATAIGPLLVTPDELDAFIAPTHAGHTGAKHNLRMTARVNGVQVSEGNLNQMDWTFAEILERCAYGVDLMPTDVIGSGTVGTGCFLELNGTGLLNDPNYPVQWLRAGDVVELEIEQLGVLRNRMVLEDDFSILELKHKA